MMLNLIREVLFQEKSYPNSQPISGSYTSRITQWSALHPPSQ